MLQCISVPHIPKYLHALPSRLYVIVPVVQPYGNGYVCKLFAYSHTLVCFIMRDPTVLSVSPMYKQFHSVNIRSHKLHFLKGICLIYVLIYTFRNFYKHAIFCLGGASTRDDGLPFIKMQWV